ncbi:MAG: CehA/McbA family metallohydrolase [Clostridiales bacterium]|nr:CehA/McbA family metallohydrolase [Clostridiales bacterium]
MSNQRQWLKGDTHLHTSNSDGNLTTPELIERCKKNGLDWAIITDHNFPAADAPYYDGDLLIIQGEEVTGRPGHFNVFGVKMPISAPYKLQSFEDYIKIINQAKDAGALISVNHPFCKRCTWYLPLEGIPMDCVEVWNAPMHIDDMTNIRWWHNQLLQGKRISAVGGSDYHKDYYVTNLLATPTTVCYAKSNTQEDILDALKSGNSFITQGGNKTMLYLTCGEAFVGETVEWHKGIQVQVKAEKIKRGHRLVVYNNDTVIFDQKAKKFGTMNAAIEVVENGFVRAEVLYEYKNISKMIYKQVVKKLMPKDVGVPIPPLAYSLTNPIFFE